MLRALKSLLGRRDPAQLVLELDAGQLRTADDLLARLRSLGLKRIATCRLTRNANVMVSWRGAELRVHEGYLSAPPDIHEAIVAFVESRSRAERRVATKRIVAFAGSTWRDSGRRERTRPEDEPLARKLEEWHARLNAEYFGGALKAVPIRVSRRMKSRLGHYTAGGPVDRWTGGPGNPNKAKREFRWTGKGLVHLFLFSMSAVPVHRSTGPPVAPPTMQPLTLTIEGMSCAHCLHAVRGRLEKTPGVHVKSVQIGSAVLEYDPSKTSVDDIEEAIADEGYTAFVAG